MLIIIQQKYNESFETTNTIYMHLLRNVSKRFIQLNLQNNSLKIRPMNQSKRKYAI